MEEKKKETERKRERKKGFLNILAARNIKNKSMFVFKQFCKTKL